MKIQRHKSSDCGLVFRKSFKREGRFKARFEEFNNGEPVYTQIISGNVIKKENTGILRS